MKFSSKNEFEQVTGFGLYDKSVVDLLRDAAEPNPNFRNMISEYWELLSMSRHILTPVYLKLL